MRSNIPSRTSISVGLRVIPPGSGFARSVVKTAGKSISVAHHGPDRTRGKDTGDMSGLLEYTLGEYQKRIDELKKIKPNTASYESLIKDIDNLQEKLDQLRQRIFEKDRHA